MSVTTISGKWINTVGPILYTYINNIIGTSAVLVSTPMPTTTPSSIPPMSQDATKLWLIILGGVLGGCIILLGLLVIITVVANRIRKKKKNTYSPNSKGQSVQKHTPQSASGKL